MNELKTHVERGVRPVRATQCLKLRMRRELLTHLEAAVAEEQVRGATDKVAADHAIARLGDVTALTRSLQAEVPLWQRVLMMRVPTTKAYDDWERRASVRWYGIHR